MVDKMGKIKLKRIPASVNLNTVARFLRSAIINNLQISCHRQAMLILARFMITWVIELLLSVLYSPLDKVSFSVHNTTELICSRPITGNRMEEKCRMQE